MSRSTQNTVVFSLNHTPKNIIIVRPDRIGDVVLSTGLPREIKKNYPDAKITMLVRDYTKELYLNNPHIDNILSTDNMDLSKFKGWLKAAGELRKYNFDTSLTLLPTKELNYILFFAGIKLRIGVGHKLYQFITNTKAVYRRKHEVERHEADFCMDAIRKIGCEVESINPEIHLDNDELYNANANRDYILGGAKFVLGIHSTSGNSAPNWEPKRYRELVDILIHNKNIRIVITDNKIPDELKNIEDVFYPNVKSGLRESMVNFASLDCLISASTGPMHIAGALKINTMSFFCPLPACSPKLWSAKGNTAYHILPTEYYCSRQCPGDPKLCNLSNPNGITPEKVIEELYRTFPELI